MTNLMLWQNRIQKTTKSKDKKDNSIRRRKIRVTLFCTHTQNSFMSERQSQTMNQYVPHTEQFYVKKQSQTPLMNQNVSHTHREQFYVKKAITDSINESICFTHTQNSFMSKRQSQTPWMNHYVSHTNNLYNKFILIIYKLTKKNVALLK